jgi:hypothetical protein
MNEGYDSLEWCKVPKQETIDHHEVLRVPLFWICCIFYFCDILLIPSDEFYFSFFMVVMTLDVDQMKSFITSELVGDGMQALQYSKRASTNVKLSSSVRNRVNWFLHLGFL